MKRRFWILLSLMLILSMVFAGCGGEDSYEDEYFDEQETEYYDEEADSEEDDEVDSESEDTETEGVEEGEQVAEEDVSVSSPEQADSGFRPEVDGFSFPNYGGDAGFTDMTPAEMQRMFGDAVCASTVGGECILTPPANQWMDQMNQYMAGGHCEGMAVLSMLMYFNQIDPAEFGGSSAHDLDIASNEPLQR